MRSSARHIASCLLCLVLGAVPVQRASADDTLRVVVRIASEADRALVPRLRGQLSDLSAQLIVTETAPLEAALAKQLEVARTLAKLQGADAVVWCASEPGAKPQRRLYIELAQSDRILSRGLLGAAAGALSSSDLETAAVLVRSTLVALAQHVEIGISAVAAAESGGGTALPGESRLDAAVEHVEGSAGEGTAGTSVERAGGAVVEHEVVERAGAPSPAELPEASAASAASYRQSQPPGEPQPSAASAAALARRNTRPRPLSGSTHPELPPAESRSDAARASMAARSSSSALPSEPVDHAELPREVSDSSNIARAALRARLMLGAQLALDGQSTAGQRGLSARAGVGFGAWAFDVYGVLSMASMIDDPNFALNVARHALGVAFERLLPMTETLSLGLALHGGALLLRRTSHAQNSGAVSMPPSLTAAFAFGPELAFSWLPSRFGLSVRFGMDILPAAPRFEIAGVTQQRSAVSHSLWSFEPRMTLAWETALP